MTSADGTPQSLKEILSRLAMDKDFLANIRNKAAAILSNFHRGNEISQIAQDALGEVIVSMLSRIENGEQPIARYTNFENAVRGYVFLSVQAYCLDRARSWGRPSTERRHEIETAPNKGRGARARLYAPINEEANELFWDQLAEVKLNVEHFDYEKIDAALKEIGFSIEEIDVIRMQAEGLSFEEIGRRLGGSADKYRKMLSRALERCGLPKGWLKDN